MSEIRVLCSISTDAKRRKFFDTLCFNAGFFSNDIKLLDRFIEIQNDADINNFDYLLRFEREGICSK
ncbi:MAG: hypothetical protein ACRCV3_00435 [Desulfovibrionaceae bacterium]